MSNEIEKVETAAQIIYQRHMPTNNDVVHGMNAQSTLVDASRIAKRQLLKAVQNRVAEDIATVNAARAATAAAQDALHKRAALTPIPQELFNDLDRIAQAMLAFNAGAEVVRVTRDKTPKLVDVNGFNFESGTFVARASVTSPESSRMKPFS